MNNWSQYSIQRVDKARVHLWELRLTLDFRTLSGLENLYHDGVKRITEELGKPPESGLLEDLYIYPF